MPEPWRQKIEQGQRISREWEIASRAEVPAGRVRVHSSLHCPRRPGAGLACQVSRSCLVLSLSLPLSLSLFHQCGYHAKLSLFRSFPFPALLLLALHPEDRDLSREVDGHDNLWMMMMMMWYTGFVTDRVPTPTLDNVSWQSLRTPHASGQRFKLLFDCCLTLGCA